MWTVEDFKMFWFLKLLNFWVLATSLSSYPLSLPLPVSTPLSLSSYPLSLPLPLTPPFSPPLSLSLFLLSLSLSLSFSLTITKHNILFFQMTSLSPRSSRKPSSRFTSWGPRPPLPPTHKSKQSHSTIKSSSAITPFSFTSEKIFRELSCSWEGLPIPKTYNFTLTNLT